MAEFILSVTRNEVKLTVLAMNNTDIILNAFSVLAK